MKRFISYTFASMVTYNRLPLLYYQNENNRLLLRKLKDTMKEQPLSMIIFSWSKTMIVNVVTVTVKNKSKHYIGMRFWLWYKAEEL